MAKRIYEFNYKKWGTIAGVSVGTLAGLLFAYLSFLGVIEITGFSGDQVCAGTIDDPCYAYINLTAKEDIFIYPVGYDPWGRDTPFEFSPAVKDWKLQRSWGKGWRDIPLDKTCTGTWCGAPNNKGVAYSWVLREDRDYKVRIVALKNSPYDTIKWAVNYEDKEYLDPTWKSHYENSYTPSTETHCIDGVCNKILYSGIRFVEEDKTWKKVEDARSLKGSGIECIVESDGINLVECVDWNMTSIELKLNQKSVSLVSKEVPIKIYQKSPNKYNMESELVLKSYSEESFSSFSNKKDKVLTNFEYGDIIHFGEHSTTIMLQDNETGNLLDTWVREDSGDANHGTIGNFFVNIQSNGYDAQSYLFFNLSSIPHGVIIENSSLFLTYFRYEVSDPDPIELYHAIYLNSSSDGSLLTETSLTFNNQPCGWGASNNFINSSFCNLTKEYTSADPTGLSEGDLLYFKTTQATTRALDDGLESVGFALRGTGYGYPEFYSKEFGTVFKRPYLNITYTEEGEDTTNPTITWEIPTPTDGDTISQNYVYLNTTISDDSNTSAFFDWNKSLVGYLSMDNYNSTGVFDNSTYDNFGTFYNMSEDNKTDGQFGDAFYFSGNDYKSYIDMGNDSEMAISNDLSLDLWVKPAVGQEFCFNGTLGNFGILGSVSGADSTSTYSYQLRYGSANNCSLGWQINTAAGGKWVTLGYNLSTDTWSHIVTTFNGTDEKIYVNGILKNTTTFAATTISTNSNNKILLGVAGWGVSNTYYEGEIDEFKIFNRVLSQEEINASYNNGLYKLYHNFTDLSNGNYNYSAYAIDTSGNLEINNERKITISEDTCTYTSGTWERDCSENCTTDENVDLGGDDIVTTNAGFWYLAANISNYGNLNLSSGCNIVFDDNTFLIS